MKQYITGANPYMPLWEHVPDGEPRVFEYGGEKRVYVYGSHDTLKTEYCGRDYVVWSAPVDNLTKWRFDGTAFSADNKEVLYAPDVVKKGNTYYMYIAMNKGREIYVAESSKPTGPFVNPKKTDFGFDIGVLVDDDGRCYAYWGFMKCFAAEINEDMATIKEGTLRCNMIPHCGFRNNLWDKANIDNEFSYFEAASIRKINGKYIFIYSKRDMVGNEEKGRKPNLNAYLDYAYSDYPLTGWIHGGTIISNAGQIITKADGTKKTAYHKCNNHGSIEKINGQWYVFYHRGSGTNEFARQAMLEPIDVAFDNDGKVYIGKISYNADHEPYFCEEVEMTSQGAFINGLDAYSIISAGRTCYIDTGEKEKRAYVKPVYDTNNQSAPVVNIGNSNTIGFKYVDFGEAGADAVWLRVKNCFGEISVKISIDGADNDEICNLKIDKNDDYRWVRVLSDKKITGKHSVFFTFCTEGGMCEFDAFSFEQMSE